MWRPAGERAVIHGWLPTLALIFVVYVPLSVLWAEEQDIVLRRIVIFVLLCVAAYGMAYRFSNRDLIACCFVVCGLIGLINGLIVTVSAADLLQQDEAGAAAMGAQLRERVDEVTGRLHLLVPVYLLVTKCDLLSGFVETFGHLPKSERGQIWGCTLQVGDSHEDGPGELVRQKVEESARLQAEEEARAKAEEEARIDAEAEAKRAAEAEEARKRRARDAVAPEQAPAASDNPPSDSDFDTSAPAEPQPRTLRSIIESLGN